MLSRYLRREGYEVYKVARHTLNPITLETKEVGSLAVKAEHTNST